MTATVCLLAKSSFLLIYCKYILPPALLLILLLTKDPPDDFGKVEIDPNHADAFTIAALNLKEATLKKVRKERKMDGWYNAEEKVFYPSLPNEWQIKSAWLAPIAFEVFLINEVWAAYGEQYRAYRYNASLLKEEMERLEGITIDEPQYLQLN